MAVDDLRSVMRAYFTALVGNWRERNGTFPKAPWLEEADPSIYVGEPDDAGWVQWLPKEKAVREDFGAVEGRWGVQIHSSVREYFDSFWFCVLGGTFSSRAVQLEPMIPGIGLAEWQQKVQGYREAHAGMLRHLPIGIESKQSLLVVVDNTTGEVSVEDYESGGFEALAGGLAELIRGLR